MENHEITEDTIREKIELSPIEKYQRFDKFPWKLAIHIALLVFTTIQAVSMVELAATYQKPMLQVFKYVLMNSTDQDFSQTFYTLNSFQEHIQGLTDTLSDLESYMLNKVDKRDANYTLDVYYTNLYINNSLHNARTKTNAQPKKDTSGKFMNDRGNSNNFTYIIPDISQGILEPFNMNNITNMKKFIQTIESMNFNIKNLYTWSQLVESQYLCYNWSITLKYEFVAMSHIISTLDAQPVYCQLANGSISSHPSSPQDKDTHSKFAGAPKSKSIVTYTPFGNNLNILHMTVFVLALASLIFGWLYVYEMGVLYMSTRHAKQMHKVNYSKDPAEQGDENAYGSAWEDMSLTEKIKFFDAFLIIMMLGNVFQILGSVVSIYQNFTPQDSNAVISIKESCVGIGCMCCWFNIIKYLTYNKEFKATTNILSASTLEFLKFLVGVVPLYLAFVFLGRCLFWKYEKFESTNHAIVALFSIMAGDIVDETYTDTSAEGILSTIFLTVWILLFMSAVHNVFISIISEGFRNKFLEDRYQELFNLYALGDKDEVSKWNVNEKDLMMMASMANMTEPRKGEDVLALMPYIRRDSDINFDPQNREKMRKTEMERQKLKETIMEKTDEVEKILGGMKDIVNEFCSVSKDKEEKKTIKNCFIRCLRDLHSFIRTELTKDTKDQPKEFAHMSRFGREAHRAQGHEANASIDKSMEPEDVPHIRRRTNEKVGLSFGKPSVSQPNLGD